mmetsp:Transcript_23864/g.40829  ORF Transcript_23864/g.40829 Transcript_23864/m.40829 type:complete len:295 (+) Transcript_23864:981-1865(+)
MNLRSIISQFLCHLLLRRPHGNLTPLRMALPTSRLLPNHKPNLSTRITRYGTIRILHGIKQRRDGLHERLDEIDMQPHAFALRTDNAPLSQTIVHGLIKRCFEKNARRSNGIGRIGNNDIERRLIFFHELRTVPDVDGHARIVESAGHEGEVLLGDADDVLVEFANDDFFDGGVTGNFAEDASVASSDDEDFFGVGMGVEGDVGHHFLIAAFIPFRTLNDPIQHEHLPILLRIKDENVLKLALLVIEHLLDLKSERLSGPQWPTFVEPSVHHEMGVVFRGWKFGHDGCCCCCCW